MGYSVSNKRVRQYHLKRPPRHQPLQGRNVGGRPSKVDNPLNVAAVRAVLEKNSVSASLTCVCRQRQPDGSVLRVRKQRRTLTGQLSTIYRSSPSIHRNLAETQFRCLVARHCQEFRKGFRKTDLCDHCRAYRKTILPRVSGFLTRCQSTMSAVCPGYWAPFWRSRPRNTLVMTTGDAEAKLVAVQKYLWETHEQEHADSRRAAREPFRIRHEEGLLVKELKLHLNIVRSYDWHMLAAAREQSSMRESLENLAPRTCYFQADFSENIGVPIASEESSDMWHGAARKTLSVFGVYLRQWQNGKVCTRNILYVSEVLEKSALFASLLIRRAVEREVLHLGKLENLLFVFDAGNHFRSYEGAYNTMVHIPRSYRQRCETRYMVEKHGKGPCDSQLFSPMRRFLKQACMLPNFFADSEHAVVAALQAAAAAEHAANPNGPTWVVEVPELPAERPSTFTLAMQNCQINRSYCFESIISARARAGVQIKNWVFSDSSDCETEQSDSLLNPEPDFAQWKKGYSKLAKATTGAWL
ncbi:unnamed protein product [Effrenium voratum]|nr:unnamed protein product [Effrenium voratum]